VEGTKLFEVKLPYIKDYVLATSYTQLVFPNIHKIAFFREPLYVNVDKEQATYYGTMTDPVGEEFINISPWSIEHERNLYKRLTEMNLVYSCAVLFPVSEIDH